jgi:hypothetical protein
MSKLTALGRSYPLNQFTRRGRPKGLKLLAPYAAKNVATWHFSVSSDEKAFPVKHSLTYLYKLQGKAGFRCPTVTLHGADWVEIVTPPSVQYRN